MSGIVYMAYVFDCYTYRSSNVAHQGATKRKVVPVGGDKINKRTRCRQKVAVYTLEYLRKWSMTFTSVA